MESEGRNPDYLIACVGGGSNAIGLFFPFLEDESVKMIGVEAGGLGINSGKHAVRFKGGKEGIIEGYSFCFSPEPRRSDPSHLFRSGRPGLSRYRARTRLSSQPGAGRIPVRHGQGGTGSPEYPCFHGRNRPLESSHAVARGIAVAKKSRKDEIIVINISGRGDKDIFIIAEALKDREWIEFLKSKVEEGY